MTDAVYRIHKGKVTVGNTASRMPGFSANHFFRACPVPSHYRQVVEAVAAIASRCAPDINFLVGPSMWGVCDAAETDAYDCRAETGVRDDGSVEYRHHGVAYMQHGFIMLAADDVLPHITMVAHHEIMHAMEGRLHPSDIEFVNRAVSRGADRPGGYLDSLVERRARFYEAMAMGWDEGARPLMVAGIPLARVDRVLWHLYTGGLARETAGGQQAQERLLLGGRLVRALAGAARQAWSELGWQGVLMSGIAGLTLARLL